MFDVTAIGELLIDFTPSGVNDTGMALFASNPGGAPANVLAMNKKLGGESAFIGKVGDDAFGRFLRTTLESIDIDVSGLMADETVLTTLAFVHLNHQGDRSFSFYRNPGADVMLNEQEIPLWIIDECKIFHFGSVSLTCDPCRTAVYSAARYAKNAGKLISFDPNYRSILWDNADTAKAEIIHALPLCDILKVSEEEMILLTGETSLRKGAVKLAAYGPAVVLVSLGEKGAFYLCGDGCGANPAYAVDTVDTTGAGDAFLGAVLYRLRNKTLNDLEQISKAELRDIVDFANAAGSLTTAKKGAIPAMPNESEIGECRRSANLLK